MAVRITAPTLKDIQSRLPSEAMARSACKDAINRAMESAKTTALRKVAEDYTIKAGKLRPRIKSDKATTQNLSASVTYRGGALNLTDYEVTPNRPIFGRGRYLNTRVSRESGFKEYRGAFLIKTGGGLKMFRRTSQARRLGDRFPITGVWGPSIPSILGATSVKEAVEKEAYRVLSDRLEHEINRRMKGLRT